MMEKDIFDWRWKDELPRSKYQLVIERENEYSKIQFRNGQFVQMDKSGEYAQDCRYFLVERFVDWYNEAHSIDIRPFINYHLSIHNDEFKEEFLNTVEDAILSMSQTNEWEPNFLGKQKVGLRCIDKYLSLLPGSRPLGQPIIEKQLKHDFDSVFVKKYMTGKRLLELLRDKYIDSEKNWIRRPSDFKGLVHFLVDRKFVRTGKYATLQKVLLTEIKFKYPSRPADAPSPKTIGQFEFLAENK